MITIKNQYLDYDKYGHCVACHDQLIIKQIIDGREEERALPKLDHVQFILNDGSKMRICICRDCKFSLDESDYPVIMECVYKGWEHEIKKLNWPQEKKTEYLDALKQKSLVRKV